MLAAVLDCNHSAGALKYNTGEEEQQHSCFTEYDHGMHYRDSGKTYKLELNAFLYV